MKMIFKFTFMMLILISCGKLEEAKKTVTDFSNKLIPQVPLTSSTYQGPYTPGSYFLILKDYGPNKDIRIFDFQYLADKTFLVRQINFSGGDLALGSFQIKTGTTVEDSNGVIAHTLNYDSCNNKAQTSIAFSGNPKDKVNVSWNTLKFSLYSYAKWMIPTDLSSKIDSIPEDLGCKKF